MTELHATEPPIGAEPLSDTKPKRPAGFPPADTPDSSWTAPLDTADLLSPEDENTSARCLLNVVVIGSTSFLCLFVLFLSLIAGYRDELKSIQTKEAGANHGTAVVQYNLALADEAAGRVLIARERYQWIQTNQPGFQDTDARLSQIEVVMAYTATPEPTATPTLAPTATPEPDTPVAPTETTSPVVAHFQDAERYFNLGSYERAMEWLKVVMNEDPSYRSQDVGRMLFTALTEQADIYFDGRNPVENEGPSGLAGNMLARGVLLTNEALALRDQNPAVAQGWTDPDRVVYTADFVTRYLSAKGYVDSSQYGIALPILEQLCNENCGWGYAGETVQGLLEQARSGG